MRFHHDSTTYYSLNSVTRLARPALPMVEQLFDISTLFMRYEISPWLNDALFSHFCDKISATSTANGGTIVGYKYAIYEIWDFITKVCYSSNNHSLLLMNSFNKTEAVVFSCRLCFLRAFHFICFTITYRCTALSVPWRDYRGQHCQWWNNCLI